MILSNLRVRGFAELLAKAVHCGLIALGGLFCTRSKLPLQLWAGFFIEPLWTLSCYLYYYLHELSNHYDYHNVIVIGCYCSDHYLC